jgi:hypothetical protein
MDDDIKELVSRLFALLTAQLEDGAALAAEGQGREPLPARRQRALTLEARIRDVHTIAQTLVTLAKPIEG